MEGTVSENKKLVGTLSSGGSMSGGVNVFNGKDGKSAYAVAVDNGFEGTEEEWLESLRGESGVYLGTGDMPDNCNVQIDPTGDALGFDTEPTLNSENLVTSDGIYGWVYSTIYDSISTDYITMSIRCDEKPTQNSQNLIRSGKIYNAFQDNEFKVVCSGVLDDTTGGVATIQAEITEDISNIRELKFYIEYPTTNLTVGSTLYLNAHINGNPNTQNTFWTVTSNKVVANTTQRSCCRAMIYDTPSGQIIYGLSNTATEHNGINTRGNALSCMCNWKKPTGTIYLYINTTATFPSGTKWILEAR